MAKKMLIDATHAEETRVVVVDGNKVEEFDFESENKRQLAGNIYLAKVTRVEPSLQAAFVDYGGNRHGFLAFSEIHPDYYQIPVADREALLEEEHAYAEAMAAEEEERDKKDKSRSNRSRRGRGRGRSSEKAAKTKSDDAVTTAEAKLPESMDVIDLGEDGDETQVVEAVTENTPETTTETAAEQASPDVAAEAGEASEAPAEAAQAEAVQEDALVVEASAEPEAQAEASEEQSSEAAESGEEAQAESTGDEENSGDEASAEADAEATTDEGEEEAAAPKRRRRSRRPSKAKQDAEQDDDNDDDDDDDDDRGIESVAEEDVAEEIHRPRKPRPRKYKIQEVVKVRQILLVQVVKEERGNKGAALTTYLSLAGRYCVLMPNTARGGGISRKITNAADRKKLKEIATEIDVPKGAGLIIRTAGSQRTKAEIKRDYEYLQRLWEEIRTLTLKSVAPAKIYEEGNLIKRSIRDLYNREIDEVLVEGDGGYRVAKDFMKMIMPSHAKNVKHYTDALPLFARYQVESYLSSMFNPVVQLKSGGYIVIGVTEALVAIDVNSGRATKEGSIEDTALKTNLEAAEEVARQLRLRDLAGLIVIDFIDMEERKNNAAVEKRMKDKLKTDRARIQVGRISGFGLMEMSRQRLRPGMIEATTQPCPHCHGTGLIRSDDNLALTILRQLEEEGTRRRSREVLLKAPLAIINYLINHKREHIAQIEQRYGMGIRLEADTSLISPDFEIEKFKTATRSVPEVSEAVISADASLMEGLDEDLSEEVEATEVETPDVDEGEEQPKKKRRRRRRRSRSKSQLDGAEGNEENGEADEAASDSEVEAQAEDQPAEEAGEAAPEAAPEAEEKPKRKRVSRSRKKKDDAGEAAAEAPAEEVKAEEAAPAEGEAEAPKKRTRRKSPAKKAAEEAPAEAAEAAPEGEEAEAKPKPKRTRRKKVEPEAEAVSAPEAVVEAAPEVVAEPVAEPAPEPTPEPTPEPVAEAPVAEPEPVAAPVAAPVSAPVAEEPKPEGPKKKGWWSLGR